MHLDNYWQGQHLYRGQANILYDPIDFKGPSFFAGLQESCLTLFAKLRQSHNLPKLDWHTGSKLRKPEESLRRRTFQLEAILRKFYFRHIPWHGNGNGVAARGEFDATTP